jgi:hypothetical protein
MSRMLLALAPVMPHRAYARPAPAARLARWRAAHTHPGSRTADRQSSHAAQRRVRQCARPPCAPRAYCVARGAGWAPQRRRGAPDGRAARLRGHRPSVGIMAYELIGCGHGKDHHGERVPRRRPGRGVARARAAVDRGEPPGSSPPPRAAARRDPRQSRRAGHARAGPHGIRPDVRQRATLPASDRLDRRARAHLTARQMACQENKCWRCGTEWASADERGRRCT